MKKILLIKLLLVAITGSSQSSLPLIKISANKRFFVTGKDQPFFWLGDTGWLLFIKCKREEAIQYLDDRQRKGYNVIQAMLVHDINLGVNAYGDSALLNKDVSKPVVTPGRSFSNAAAYDFWDNVDYVIEEAAKRGIYMALVPIWGGNIKHVNSKQAAAYAAFLAKRYKKHNNIIWLNGGDIKGTDGFDQWNTIGNTLYSLDKRHLITFHPRERNSSSTWFHNAPWLDFNMFQSGHRSYAQDTSVSETLHYGEDNWRYVVDDYSLTPTKPTLDGEPSYEGIPYGLHKANEPYWQDYEIRRYAYWSVFAGAAGFTYGHNSVMQFYTPGDSGVSFFPKVKWQDGLTAPGAGQLGYLKELILSHSYFDRLPAQQLVLDNDEKYNKVLATRGLNYAMFYTYNGRDFTVDIAKIGLVTPGFFWFDPRTGSKEAFTPAMNSGLMKFNPPGEIKNGNDWVLIIEQPRMLIR